MHVSRNVGRSLVLCVVVLTVGVTAGVVAAATPKKGSYVGTLPETSTRLEKRLVLKVSSSGTGRVRLECSGTRVGLSSEFEIVNGQFTALKKTGSLLVWRLRGKFTSRTTAAAKLYLAGACDGKGGKVKLKLAG
jgi:hypothetical protein